MNRFTIKRIFALIFAITTLAAAPVRPATPQSRHKVALVLSGGGARGASHIGVLRVFEREHIPIDCIAGTSFGALAGGLYAIGYSTNEIEHILSGQDWNNIFSDAPERRLTPLIERRNARYQAQISFRGWSPELPTGFSGGQRLTEFLDLLTTSRLLRANYDFDRLPIQFRAVSTNLVDGRPYVFSHGSMTEALRASIAIPLLFTPVEKDGMLLVDGGLANNLPTDVARALGADIIIAVDATSPLLARDKIRNFIDVADQSISLQMEKNVQENRSLANIVLHPSLGQFTFTDFNKIPEILKQGEAEANRRLNEIKALIADVAPHPPTWTPLPVGPVATIESISFSGLKKIKSTQLAASLHVRPGDAADPYAIGADVGRLYASHFFESVGYALEPLAGGGCHLVFIMKESPLNMLGIGLRYDNDYNFVALAEFTARQLFNSSSNLTVSSQFGGLEDHLAALRLVPSPAPFLFLEPKVEVMRLERLDFRDQNVVDRFTDARDIGRVVVGGTVFPQLEISAGYLAERVRIEGGSEPNTLAGSVKLAGLAFRLNRDSLDSRDFPQSGMTLRVQIDKRSRSLGGDLDYSKWEADWQRYIPISERSTLQFNSTLGYSRGPVPFYDLFFVGGYSFSQIASRQFLGLQRDELAVNQMAIAGTSYRRTLFSHGLSFFRRGYLTAIYNALFYSNRQQSPYNFELVNGAGIDLAVDTMVGPVHAAGGWAERGGWNFYITLGSSF